MQHPARSARCGLLTWTGESQGPVASWLRQNNSRPLLSLHTHMHTHTHTQLGTHDTATSPTPLPTWSGLSTFPNCTGEDVPYTTVIKDWHWGEPPNTSRSSAKCRATSSSCCCPLKEDSHSSCTSPRGTRTAPQQGRMVGTTAARTNHNHGTCACQHACTQALEAQHAHIAAVLLPSQEWDLFG